MMKKHPKSSLKSYFLHLRKHLKFENSSTRHQTYMKLGPDMYLLNTFRLQRNEGVNQWAGEGAYKKPLKNAIKLTKFRL